MGGGPLVIRTVVRGLKRTRLLPSGGRPVALASTGAHDVRVTLVIPHGGATPLDCLQLIGVM